MNPEIIETIVNRLSSIPLYTALVVAIFILTKWLKIEKLDVKFIDSKKSVFYMFTALFYSTIATILFVRWISEKEFYLTWPTIGFITLENIIVFILPVLLILRLEGSSLESAGISRKNLKNSLLLTGPLLLLSALILDFRPNAILTGYASMSLIKALVIAAGEETYFRGFLQLKCQALFGDFKGAALSTLLFSLYHLPIISLYEGTIPFMLVMNLLTTLIFGSFQAILMHKTQNTASPILFHGFMNW